MASVVRQQQVMDSNPNPLDNATKCNHFSIRGYVAELRQRDPKLCDPFSPYGIHESSTELRHELPPMVVPKFRWWNCDGCVPASTETGKQIHSSADDEKYPSKELIVNASNGEATTTCSDRKGKGKAHVEDEVIKPQEIDFGSGCDEDVIVAHSQKNDITDEIEEGVEIGSLVSLPDLNECERVISDDGEEIEELDDGNGDVCEEEEDYFAIDNRKNPKERLLSELLGLKESHNKRKNPSSSDFRGYESQVATRKKRGRSVEISDSDSDDEDESIEIVSEDLVRKCSKKIKIDHRGFGDKSYDQMIPLPREIGISSDLDEKRSGSSKRKGKMVQDGSCVHHFPDSDLRKEKTHVNQWKDGLSFLPSSPVEPIISDYSVITSINETSLGFTTSGGASITASQFDGARERSTGLRTNSKGKQAQIPQFQELSRHIQDIDLNSIPPDDKVTGDDCHDIPMDIVELMAKHQYERNLGDSKEKPHPTSIFVNSRSNGGAGICRDHMPQLKKDSSKKTVLGTFSDFNGTHLSFRDHSLTFSHGQDPYSALNLTANSWNRHTGTQQRSPPSFLQTMGSYNTCRTSSSPQFSIESHAWPSVVAKNKGKSTHQDSWQSMDFSNAYSNSKGSSDLCSSEVIPAMHLLSLMQDGAKAQSSVGVGTHTDTDTTGKVQVFKRAPIFPDHQQQHNGRTSTHQCYSALSSVCCFASSCQSDGGIRGRNAGFLTPIPLTSRGQRNIESSHFASYGGGGALRPPKPVSCNVGRKRQLDSELQGTKLATMHDERTVFPRRQTEFCVMSQNPSEFNDLKELRRYMIRPEDLRPREVRHQKSARRGTNAKKQEMRMNKHIPCFIRNVTGEVPSM